MPRTSQEERKFLGSVRTLKLGHSMSIDQSNWGFLINPPRETRKRIAELFKLTFGT